MPKKRRLHSLRVPIVLGVGGVMFLLLTVLMAVFSISIERSFGDLQDRLTQDRLHRVERALTQMTYAKIRLLRDSAEWDETFRFITGKEPDYLQRNFSPQVNSSEQDVILVFDARKSLVGSAQPTDPQNPWSTPAGMDLPALAASRLFQAQAAAGLVWTKGGIPLLLASCPVLPSDRQGAPNGWLVFGTFVRLAQLNDLLQATGVEGISVRTVVEKPFPPETERLTFQSNILGPLDASYIPVRDGASESAENAALAVPVLDGRRMLFDIRVSLGIYERAVQTRNWILMVSVVCGFASMCLGLLTVEFFVIRPLVSLDHQISDMVDRNTGGDLLHVPRDDEIGRLAASANRLLSRVQHGQRDAEEQHKLVDSILDSAAEGIIACLAIRNQSGAINDFRIVVCNRAAENLLHLQSGALTGETLLASFSGPKGAEIFEHCVRTVTDKRRRTWEGLYHDVNLKAWLYFSFAPWDDGFVSTFKDIGDRKGREEELARTYAEIERFNAAMIGREERVVEMKREVNRLRKQLGMESLYADHES